MSYFEMVSKQLFSFSFFFLFSRIPLPPTQTKASTRIKESKQGRSCGRLEGKAFLEATPKSLQALKISQKNFCPQQSPH